MRCAYRPVLQQQQSHKKRRQPENSKVNDANGYELPGEKKTFKGRLWTNKKRIEF